MIRPVSILLFTLAALGVAAGYLGQRSSVNRAELAEIAAVGSTQDVAPPPVDAIKVSIATTSVLLGPAATRYRAGEQIPVAITLTNSSAVQASVCISSDIYQNLPKLTRDGKEVPYLEWQSEDRLAVMRNRTCENENLPEPLLLKPNVPALADWLILSDGPVELGEDSWYGKLPVGKYQLSIQRRLTCCEGPLVKSNEVSFEVVP